MVNLNNRQPSGRELNKQEVVSSEAKDLKDKQRWEHRSHNSSLGRHPPEDHFLAGQVDKLRPPNHSSDCNNQVSVEELLALPLNLKDPQVEEGCLGQLRRKAVVVSSEVPSHRQALQVADCLVEELVAQVWAVDKQGEVHCSAEGRHSLNNNREEGYSPNRVCNLKPNHQPEVALASLVVSSHSL